MASIKNLKKDINYTLGDIIEECYVVNLLNAQNDSKKTDAIIDEAVEVFDTLIEKLNAKNIQDKDKKAHYKSISIELESKAKGLVEKINGINAQ